MDLLRCYVCNHSKVRPMGKTLKRFTDHSVKFVIGRPLDIYFVYEYTHKQSRSRHSNISPRSPLLLAMKFIGSRPTGIWSVMVVSAVLISR